MNLYPAHEHPLQEPDSEKREKMMFFDPYQVLVLEGCHEADLELQAMVIMSSN